MFSIMLGCFLWLLLSSQVLLGLMHRHDVLHHVEVGLWKKYAYYTIGQVASSDLLCEDKAAILRYLCDQMKHDQRRLSCQADYRRAQTDLSFRFSGAIKGYPIGRQTLHWVCQKP